MVSITVDKCLQRQIAQKIIKSKIKAHPVNAAYYMAFKNCIAFAAYLAVNLGFNRFRIIPDIVSKLLSPPTEVAVLFYSNLVRRLLTDRWPN